MISGKFFHFVDLFRSLAERGIFKIGKKRKITLTQHARHIEKVNQRLYEILAANCGVSVEQIEADCDRDYHLSALEAIAYGLADHPFSSFDE